MSIRIQRRNLFPSQALTAGTVTSQTENATVGKGVRLYVYVSAVTAGGGTDSLNLVALPPNGTAVVLAGFSHANMLAAAGTLVFDFYPGQTNSGFAGANATIAVGANYGSIAIALPLKFAVQLTIGAANAATIAIDAEILP